MKAWVRVGLLVAAAVALACRGCFGEAACPCCGAGPWVAPEKLNGVRGTLAVPPGGRLLTELEKR